MSKLFVFHGADSKVGVSMVTQSVAEMIAGERPDLKILMVNLQGRYGAAYTGYVGENIEGLRHYLDNRVLNRKELLEGCRCTENLYVIGGVKSIGEERYYQPEMSAYLLAELTEEFDLIFADSGSDLDNGLALGSLVMADELLLVLTQQEAVLRRYEILRKLYGQLKLSFSLMILNHFEKEDPYTVEYICRRLGAEKDNLLLISETAGGRKAEVDSKTLLSYRNAMYAADILAAANKVMELTGLGAIEKQRKKRWKNFI